jgi:hypothetical protein
MATFADPFQSASPFLRQHRRQTSPLEELTATREKPAAVEQPDAGLLSQIGHSALSGLSRVGNLLDVPGSMVRDVATLNNPFDQLLPWNLTTSEHRTSGRDLVRQMGLAGEDDTVGNWWGGFGAEALLDPLTYLTAGTLTAAGKVARNAGKLTKGLRASIKAGERSLFSVGLPFTDHATHLGTGPTAQKFASGLDSAIGAVANSPPGRMVQGLFNPEVMGQFSGLGQSVAKMMYPARQNATLKTAEQVSQYVEPLTKLRQAFHESFGEGIESAAGGKWREISPDEILQPGAKMKLDVTSGKSHVWEPGPTGAKVATDLTNHTFERLLGMTAELGGDFDRAAHYFSIDPKALAPELRQQFIDVTNDMQKAAASINAVALAKGGWGGVLNTPDDFEHFMRYAKLSDKDYANAAREFATVRGSSAHRSDLIGLIPEEVVNRMLTDPAARYTNDEDFLVAVAHIADKYGDFLGKGTVLNEAGETVQRWGGIGDHAEAMAQWVKAHPQRAIFLNPKIEDFARYMRQAHLADATMDVVHELAGRNMGPIGVADLTGTPTPGVPKVPLDKFYKEFAKMNPERAIDYLAAKTGRTAKDLKKLGVPHEIAQAVQATRNFQEDPRWLRALGDTIDHFTNFWKQSVTLPFPSFAGRNLGSGQYVNASSGLMPTFAHLSNYGQHVLEALGMIKSGLDPALERELVTYGVFNPRQLSEGVDAGTAYAKFGSAMPENPLDWRATWGQAGQAVNEAGGPADALGAITGKDLPFADRIPTLTGARQAAGFVMGTGAKVNQWVEFLNRVPMYKYLRSQGWDAAAAAGKVKELQIDYSQATFSPFENQVMKRMVPFYSFQRKIAPVILRNLLERPGGLMAQTIRASRLAAGNDPTTPDYIAEGLSIPNPFKTPEPGGQSYLGGFGLPYEQLAQYVAAPHVMGRELLSQLNPLVKMPLEMATGQTFFQSGPGGYGRPLEDLDPPIGRTISNIAGWQKPVDLPDWFEHVASNSPATRFISTARQLSDPRKTPFDLALANLTGIRPVDVSPAAADAVLRDRSVELMHDLGAKTFARTYFPADELANMSPAEREKANGYNICKPCWHIGPKAG